MHLIILLIVFVGLAAIIVWLADYTSDQFTAKVGRVVGLKSKTRKRRP